MDCFMERNIDEQPSTGKARLAHVCAGTRRPPPHLRRDLGTPRHICTAA